MRASGVAVSPVQARPFAAWTKSYALEGLASGRTNNFNLLRFFAASLVIFSHCYAVAWGTNFEPIYEYLGRLETGGSLGVLVFFSISGFLIAQSFARRSRVMPFLAARILRIYPGLIAATVFSALLASFATTLPRLKFWTDDLTQTFLLHNSLGYPTIFDLPGTFAMNPDPRVVNGSLWTLPIEMEMYLLVAALGIAGYFAHRALFNAFFGAFLVYVIIYKPAESLLVYGNTPEVGRMAMIFLFGMFLYVNRDRVPLSIPGAALLLAAIALLYRVPRINLFYLPAVAYIVLVMAYHPKLYFAAFNRWGDYSYGLYIYAFPVQQLIAYYDKGIRAVPLFLLAYPCILAVAMFSWRFIEEPMLRLKPKGAAAVNRIAEPVAGSLRTGLPQTEASS
jgi:peptidoglycan/LPS O-acetylase OafA/YrhL